MGSLLDTTGGQLPNPADASISYAAFTDVSLFGVTLQSPNGVGAVPFALSKLKLAVRLEPNTPDAVLPANTPAVLLLAIWSLGLSSLPSGPPNSAETVSIFMELQRGTHYYEVIPPPSNGLQLLGATKYTAFALTISLVLPRNDVTCSLPLVPSATVVGLPGVSIAPGTWEVLRWNRRVLADGAAACSVDCVTSASLAPALPLLLVDAVRSPLSPGSLCLLDEDCTSGSCLGGVCCALNVDPTRCVLCGVSEGACTACTIAWTPHGTTCEFQWVAVIGGIVGGILCLLLLFGAHVAAVLASVRRGHESHSLTHANKHGAEASKLAAIIMTKLGVGMACYPVLFKVRGCKSVDLQLWLEDATRINAPPAPPSPPAIHSLTHLRPLLFQLLEENFNLALGSTFGNPSDEALLVIGAALANAILAEASTSRVHLHRKLRCSFNHWCYPLVMDELYVAALYDKHALHALQGVAFNTYKEWFLAHQTHTPHAQKFGAEPCAVSEEVL